MHAVIELKYNYINRNFQIPVHFWAKNVWGISGVVLLDHYAEDTTSKFLSSKDNFYDIFY